MLWWLQRKGAGYSRRDLAGLGKVDIVLLWRLLRGPSGFSMIVGFLYGLLLGLMMLFALWPSMIELWGTDAVVYATLALALFVLLSWMSAMYVSARTVRRENPFYRYVRRCRALMWVEGWPARSLDSRRRLAALVGAWSLEAEAKKIRAESVRRELELLVDREQLSEEDLRRVSDLARRAALLPFRGHVDMRALMPELLPADPWSRARVWARGVPAWMAGLAALLTASVPILNS